MTVRALAASLLLVAVLSAQVDVFWPSETLLPSDPSADVPFGCLPTYPGGLGYTFVQRIPAGVLDPTSPVIQDIAFASDPTLTNLGSFNDLTFCWNWTERGPFWWNAYPSTWNLLGLAHLGGSASSGTASTTSHSSSPISSVQPRRRSSRGR